MERPIYGITDELRKDILNSFLLELVESNLSFQDALTKSNKHWLSLYKKGEIKFFITEYYIERIFTDHLFTMKGFKELFLNNKQSMSKKEMSKDEIIVKLFKQHMRSLKDFDKAIDASVSLMNEKGYPVDQLEFHNVLAKHMYQLVKGNLKNTLNFIKTASKEELQAIISEAQSYLVA